MGSYKIIGHTSEVALELEGADAARLFEAAADGLLAIYAAPKPEPLEMRELRLKAQPIEDLLVAWLNELIYYIGTKKWLPARTRVAIDGDGLHATLEGAPLGTAKLSLEIKAATFGGLSVQKEADGSLRTTVILDV